MNILLVSHNFLPHVGGLEVLVHYEIEALTSEGHSVVLITSDNMGNAQTPRYPSNVRVIRVPCWNILERLFNLPYPLFAPKLCSEIWREAGTADAVHIHGFMFHSSVTAAIIGKLRRRPIVLTDHGGIQKFSSRLKRILAWCGAHSIGRLTAMCANKLVAYNTRITQLLEELTRRRGQAHFLPNPVDQTVFWQATIQERERIRSSLGWPRDRTKLLFVGRLTVEKGVSVLAKCVDPSRYDIVFCGTGDTTLLGQLPRPGIELLPARPQTELAEVYRAADMLVVPSQPREGFPLVVQEGLACGLPVILGYERGFDPYRVISRLHFCEPTVSGLQNAIDECLSPQATTNKTQDISRFCPNQRDWIRKLYEGIIAAPNDCSSSQTVTP